MNHNIFALELCLRLEPGSLLRIQLKELLVSHPDASSPGQKWQMLRRISELLLAHEHLFEKGCWDFFDDDGRALRDYEMWTKGMTTEEGARKAPSGEGFSEPRYMTFTIALLLAAGTPCAREVAGLCDIPEAHLWRKSSFTRILRGLPRVSFSAVKSDVLYLIPGEQDWGLTAEDLEAPKFEYLREIV